MVTFTMMVVKVIHRLFSKLYLHKCKQVMKLWAYSWSASDFSTTSTVTNLFEKCILKIMWNQQEEKANKEGDYIEWLQQWMDNGVWENPNNLYIHGYNSIQINISRKVCVHVFQKWQKSVLRQFMNTPHKGNTTQKEDSVHGWLSRVFKFC